MALMFTDRLKLAVLKRHRSESQHSQPAGSADIDSFKPPDWNNVVQTYLEVTYWRDAFSDKEMFSTAISIPP
jgi:hypothetical protein